MLSLQRSARIEVSELESYIWISVTKAQDLYARNSDHESLCNVYKSASNIVFKKNISNTVRRVQSEILNSEL